MKEAELHSISLNKNRVIESSFGTLKDSNKHEISNENKRQNDSISPFR